MNIARDSSAREMTWKPPVSTDAVKAKTGRGWEEWLSILDQEQGPALGHTAPLPQLIDARAFDSAQIF